MKRRKSKKKSRKTFYTERLNINFCYGNIKNIFKPEIEHFEG